MLITLGGAHVAAFGVAALADTMADVAVAGEGELAMEQIARAFLEGEGMEDIPGIIRRDPDGNVVVNPGAQLLIKDIDSLPKSDRCEQVLVTAGICTLTKSKVCLFIQQSRVSLWLYLLPQCVRKGISGADWNLLTIIHILALKKDRVYLIL